MNILSKSNRIFLGIAALSLLFTACSDDNGNEEQTLPSIAVQQEGTSGKSNVTVKFTPSDNTQKFTYAIGSSDQLADFEAGTLDGIETQNGSSVYIKTFTDLLTDTEYTVFARAENSKGKGTTTTALVSTSEGELFEAGVDIIADDNATVYVRTTDNIRSFRYVVAKPTERDAFVAGTLIDITTILESREQHEIFYNLQPGTDYMVYAQGQFRDGTSTNIVEVPFTTLAEGSCPKLGFTLEDAHPVWANFTLTPNSHASFYRYMLVAKGKMGESLPNFHGSVFDLMVYIQDFSPNDLFTEQETSLSKFYLDYKPGSEYELFTLVYGQDGEPFNAQVFTFETVLDPNVGEAVMESITVKDIGDRVATAVYTPGANTEGVFYEFFYGPLFEGRESDYDVYDYLVLQGVGGFQLGNTPFENTQEGFSSGSKYYAVALPMNHNGLGGINVDLVYTSDPFYTTGTPPQGSQAAPMMTQALRNAIIDQVTYETPFGRFFRRVE